MTQDITSWTLNPEARIRFHIGLHGFRSEQRVEWALPQVFWYYLIRIKSTMLRTHSFVYHRHNIIINLQPRYVTREKHT